MHADLLVTNISQLVTAPGSGAVHGPAMSRLDVIADGAVATSGGSILWAGRRRDWTGTATTEVDAGGHAVIPALIDPHTHAVWRGDRLADFEARSEGAGYEQILARGGGIRTTIRETNRDGGSWSSRTSKATEGSARDEAIPRSARDDSEITALADLALPRVQQLVASGAATIEIKSGYGFTREGELRLLEAIAIVAEQSAARIVPTLLIHVPPADIAERPAYLAMVVGELIPDAARRHLAHAVDVFIERESFSVDDARVIFAAARVAGLPVKAHVDQFHAIGGLELAVECGALSVDHLEASGDAQIAALAASNTIGVLMPGVALHLGIAPASGRALIDAGAAVALATDLNPGSAPLFSMQLAMALGVRLNRLTAAEALIAATANGAAALGLRDTGRIAPGLRADLIVTTTPDWRDSVYLLGASPVERIFIAGKEVSL